MHVRLNGKTIFATSFFLEFDTTVELPFAEVMWLEILYARKLVQFF
jgi:hypothetical protein